MTWARWIARMRGLISRRAIEAELDEELRFHVEQETAANQARGMSASEARRAALRDLGCFTATKASVGDVRSTWTDAIWRDLLYAVRTLRSTPGMTATAVLTLALAIGANTAVFSVVYSVLVRPLPYEQPDRLALIVREQMMSGAGRPVPAPFFAPAEITAWRAQLRSFESTALYTVNEIAALRSESGPDLIDVAVVSDSFFSTMRGAMVAGRGLGVTDDDANIVVISERLSGRLFREPREGIGRVVVLSSRPYEVIGVADRSFQFPSATTDVWMSAGFKRSLNARCCGFRMVGRLTPHASLAQARAEAAGLALSRPPSMAGPMPLHATVVGLHDQIVEPVRPALLVLFAAAGLVLVAACANVAHLRLVRQMTRLRERAIRAALGASRARLVGQSMIESFLLSAVGVVAGLALAEAAVALLSQANVPVVSRDSIEINGSVLVFSALLMVLTAFSTGLAPALLATSPADALKAGSMTSTPSGRVRRLPGVFSVAQLAVSLVLLIGASLLGRSLVFLLKTDLGVSPDHVVTASMNLPFGVPTTDATARARFARVTERIQAVPGVQSVGLGTALPPNASRLRLTLRLQRGAQEADYQASAVAVTPGYFQALGLRLLKGRLFTAADDLDHPPVMIMSEDTAKRFFGEGELIGRTMWLPGSRDGAKTREEMTLVGIVANVRYSGLEVAADDALYRPFTQQTWVAPFLAPPERSKGSFTALARPIRSRTRSRVS